MTKDEALDLALEALENSVDLVREDAYNAEKLYGNYPSRQGKVGGLKVLADDHAKAITAIKQARSAPVQEPVAWMHKETGLLRQANKAKGGDFEPNHWTPLYTTPLAAQPAPVPSLRSTIANDAWAISFQSLGQYRAALLKLIDAAPPAAQRQWVGLTEREVGEVIDGVHISSRYGHHHTGFWVDFYRSIEAKLKEKNT